MAKPKKSKKASKEKPKSSKKEEVCEIFEVKQKGKEKIKTVCGVAEKKKASKAEVKRYNKILRNILITLGVIVILIFGGIYYINSLKYFEYRGVNGEVVKEGDIIFYRVPFPVIADGKIHPYNIYLRNNPVKLDKQVPFIFNDEEKLNVGIKFSDNMHRLVINGSDDFDCDGDAGISVINLLNLKALGIRVVKDENATCDPGGRYMFVNIKEGETSEIRQIGKACYELSVSECEILKVTERFMSEIFVEFYEAKGIKWEF
jgi:hypothetical protein